MGKKNGFQNISVTGDVLADVLLWVMYLHDKMFCLWRKVYGKQNCNDGDNQNPDHSKRDDA